MSSSELSLIADMKNKMYIAAFLLVLISIVSPLSAGEKGTIDESSLKYWSLKNVKITALDSAKGIYCYTATVKGKRDVIMILSDSNRLQVANQYQPVLLSRLPLHVVNADIGMPLAPSSLYYVYKDRMIGADEFGISDKIHYGLLDADTLCEVNVIETHTFKNSFAYEVRYGDSLITIIQPKEVCRKPLCEKGHVYKLYVVEACQYGIPSGVPIKDLYDIPFTISYHRKIVYRNGWVPDVNKSRFYILLGCVKK